MTSRRQQSVFVYGTLRPGQGNYRRLLEGRTTQETPCIAIGLALFGDTIPYAVRFPGARIVGDLITIDPTRYGQVLANLDRLEGYHADKPADSHYIRTTRSVIATNPLPGRTSTHHTAWIYLAGAWINPDRMTRIPADDWLAQVSAR
jgi:gamma-glutamylcyclotransferase (GGCT)/AIG2-like uncharacterized protein YtfP